MYIVHRKELELARFAEDDDTRGIGIDSVKIEPGATVVMNGHYLIRANVERIGAVDYPVADPPIPNGADGPIQIGKEDALALAKALPKKAAIPVLECAVVASNGKTVTGAVAHLPGWTRREHKADAHGKFPGYEKCMPSGEIKAQVTVDPRYLKSLADAAVKLGARSITIQIRGENEPVMMVAQCWDNPLNGKELELVLMPRRK